MTELRKMPQDAIVTMWVEPGDPWSDIYWVERRNPNMVHLNDKYWTSYAECEEETLERKQYLND